MLPVGLPKSCPKLPGLGLMLCAALAWAAVTPCAGPARAQDYFVPNAPRATAPPAGPRAARRVQPRPAPPPVEVAPPAVAPAEGVAREAQTPQQQALPPPPDLPALPKGPSPPAAVIGVLGVPDVMRGSTAAQQVEKIIGERREKLNEDAQREQGAWRDLQQELVNDRAKLSADQIRTRERQLQERITNAQKAFRDRGRIIQDSAQYALAQIERTLIAVIRQVADSRGMNLVLHRQQVALNVNEFDITEQVASQMNKILPSVIIPPDGVEPPTVPASMPTATLPPAPEIAPASATRPAGVK
jgi:Skp family chaperone for outer membrane proteins